MSVPAAARPGRRRLAAEGCAHARPCSCACIPVYGYVRTRKCTYVQNIVTNSSRSVCACAGRARGMGRKRGVLAPVRTRRAPKASAAPAREVAERRRIAWTAKHRHHADRSSHRYPVGCGKKEVQKEKLKTRTTLTTNHDELFTAFLLFGCGVFLLYFCCLDVDEVFPPPFLSFINIPWL